MPIASAQPSFDELGLPLAATTFCVVDLETTGGGAECEITEIGAVKVRGGELLGEFQTLVRPSGAIPPMIQVLTGITHQMVAGAPPLSVALPSFATFAAGCVLVAHNASFDVRFLRRGFDALGLAWPRPQVVDTVALARQALLPGEVRNHKLATLAAHFGAGTQPTHRALADAQATVDVLHGLLERVGNLGVATLEDLNELVRRVSPQRRAKRVWARDLPSTAGVYWFVCEGPDASGAQHSEVLYVGTSTNLRRRVGSYFSAAEPRAHIHEMVRVSTGVSHVTCETPLEAEVRELRMIAAHAPRYNRRSKRQHRLWWLRLTSEAFPRLSVVRRPPTDGAPMWGPFRSHGEADEVALALYDAFRIRRCTRRLSRRAASAACALGEMGRCLAPCQLGPAAEQYPDVVAALTQAWQFDPRPVVIAARSRLARLVGQERFEEAAEVAGRLRAVAAASRRFHRLQSLARCPELVAAAPSQGLWEIHVIRYGRLAAAGRARASQTPAEAELLARRAETVLAPPAGLPAGSVEEAERIAAWLERPGVRLLSSTGEWSWPRSAVINDEDLIELATGTRAEKIPWSLGPEDSAGPMAGARYRQRTRRLVRPA
ncbi:MAG: DEDD exonuclease domain-containing protein [Arachnia sp.]